MYSKKKNQRIYGVMKNKIEKALKKDTLITVTYKTGSRGLHSIGKNGKPRYIISKTSRVLHLSDVFIESCKKEAERNKKKSTADIILSRLYDLRHDYKARYFIIS
jgi:hypothetical protein